MLFLHSPWRDAGAWRATTPQLLLVLLGALCPALPAQPLLKQVLVANGGRFLDPTDNANLLVWNPQTGLASSVDTVQTQSIQDLLVEDHFAYLAAQDSIVRYDLTTGQRLAAAAFGAPSTIHLGRYGDYLLVGNWYAPFGWTGPYPNHFRLFDAGTLAFVDSIPQVAQGARDFVVLGDTAYIAQNYTTASYTDSAGYLSVVDLRTRTYVRDITFPNQGQDLGRLLLVDSVIYAFNPASDTRTTYDIRDGSRSTQPVGADIQTRDTGPQLARADSLVYLKLNGGLGSLAYRTGAVVDTLLIDTVVTAFAFDPLAGHFYLSQTDFFSFTQGAIYDLNGVKLSSLPVGSSPEAIALAYNQRPQALPETATVATNTPLRLPLLDNDSDPEGYALTVELFGGSSLGLVGWTDDSLSFIANQPGLDTIHYVVIDVWGDRDTAQAIIEVVPATGIAAPALRLQAWPNPTTGTLQLRSSASGPAQLTLLDLQGRRLRTGDWAGRGPLPFDLGGLPAGLYLLHLR
ncbi:MAG: T9SS C-terminal target domain-containing protein, partial [Bacteroidetes bacterium]